MSSSYILSPKKSRPFGKIHKSATIVLAPLHTFLINTLLIFNRFSAIMYIETEAEAIPRSLKRTFIFLPLFSFRKGPGADWSSAPGFFPAVYDKNPRFQRNGGQCVEKVQIRDRRGRRPRRPGGKTLRFLMVFGEFATFACGPSGTPAPTNRFIDRLNPVSKETGVSACQQMPPQRMPGRLCLHFRFFVPIRRADHSDQSSRPNGLIRLPDSQNELAVGPADQSSRPNGLI